MILPDHLIIKLPLSGVPLYGYPCFNVTWDRGGGSMLSFKGVGTFWRDGNNRVGRDFEASLTLSAPAYHVTLIIEPNGGGAWRLFGNLPPDITIPTFWWASELFLESLRDHPHAPNKKENVETGTTLP